MADPNPAADPAARRGPEAADEAIKDASENPPPAKLAAIGPLVEFLRRAASKLEGSFQSCTVGRDSLH
jgi:hypothetical protein